MYPLNNYPTLKEAVKEDRALNGMADVHLRAATAILVARVLDGALSVSIERLAEAIDRIGRSLIPYASSPERWRAYAHGVRYEDEAQVNERWRKAIHKALDAGKVDWHYNPMLTLSLADTIEAQLGGA